MANGIIAQDSDKCNGILFAITKLEAKARTGDFMAALALRRGNAPARDMFASNGGDIFLDGLDLSPTETVADFLGVSHPYLLNLMTRYRFTPKTTPEDVVASRPSKEFIDSAPYDIYKSSNDSVDFYHRTRYQHVTVRHPDTVSYFISPRVALCVCFLMKYGQKIPKNSMAAIIARNAENGSSYGIEALKIAQSKREAENAQRKNIENELERETASVSLDGDVKMTTEFFASIFKDFSREFSTAFSKEFTKAYMSMQPATSVVASPITQKPLRNKKPGGETPRQHSREKKELPANWAEMVSGYTSGMLTQRDIAKEMGWCVQTVRRYLREAIQA